MNPEYDDSNLHMDNLHTTNMDDDGNGLDDEDGAVVQRRYSGQRRCSGDKWLKVGRRCHHDGRTNKQGNIELLS